MSDRREIFSQRMQDALSARTGYRCSNPECRRFTYVTARDTGKRISTGVEVLISSELEGDPRYDISMTDEERKSIKNRIWLCPRCAGMIDQDVTKYPSSLLHIWKKEAEELANQELLMNSRIKNILKNSKENELGRGWNQLMFLEERGGKTLKDIYILPHYCKGDHSEIPNEIDSTLVREDNLDEYLENMINGTVETEEMPISLILGAPGTGKSCLFTYMLNREGVQSDEGRYVYAGKRMYVFRFSDLTRDFKWKSENANGEVIEDETAPELLKQLLIAMKGGDTELRPEKDLRNTILMLDGFDECMASEKQRTEILKLMAQEWGKYSRIFITCRHDYIRDVDEFGENISCISLQKMNKGQILRFVEKYEKVSPADEEGKKNVFDKVKDFFINRVLEEELVPEVEEDIITDYITREEMDVYGIPIIWYMMLALDLDQYPYVAIGNVYGRIFSEEGGIYEKCISSDVEAAGRVGRLNIDQSRIKEYSRYLIQVSHEIALYIFAHNGNQDVRIKELRKILEEKEIRFEDNDRVPISLTTAFQKGLSRYINVPSTENEGSTVRFIHKSMYEYFMADYLYVTIVDFYKGKDRAEAYEKLHRQLAILLRDGSISKEIEEFLIQKLEQMGKVDFSLFEKALIFMLKKGLTYYLVPKITEKERRNLEQLLFQYRYRQNLTLEDNLALVERIKKWGYDTFEKNPVFAAERKREEADIFEQIIYLSQIFRKVEDYECLFEDNQELREILPKYIGLRHYSGQNGQEFNLSGLNLSYMNLSHMNLSGYDFSGVRARGTNFQHSNLVSCQMKLADLSEANFRFTNLSYSVFTAADLSAAAFTGADLTGTVPAAKELFDDEKYGVPWTEMKGYIPERNYEHGMKIGDFYPERSDQVFGRYAQERREKREQYEQRPIKWRILELKGNRAMLISDRILDVHEYCTEKRPSCWKNSDVRAWLNDEEKGFISLAFSEDERKRICRTWVEPDSYIDEKYMAPQGEASIDKVFLLSGREVYKYYAKLRMEKNKDPRNLVNTSLSQTSMTGYAKGEEGVSDRLERWWLRTVSGGTDSAMYVNLVGQVCAGGESVENKKIGIRPVVWIDLGDTYANRPKGK